MGKLVRDRVPDIIEMNEHRKPRTSVFSSSQIVSAAFNNLLEEVQEATEAALYSKSRLLENQKGAIAEEIGDILESVEFVCHLLEIPLCDARQAQITKRNFKGGFSRRISLDE